MIFTKGAFIGQCRGAGAHANAAGLTSLVGHQVPPGARTRSRKVSYLSILPCLGRVVMMGRIHEQTTRRNRQ